MNDYLKTLEGLESEEVLIAERQKVQAVIARLLLKDHVLLIAEDAPSADQRVLMKHPNYNATDTDPTSFKKRA